MPSTIVFLCDVCGRPARLKLLLSARSRAHREVACEVRTAAPGYSASIEYTLLGYDVARFVDELHRLRKTLAGTAQLVTFDELLDVRLSVVDAGRGTVRLDLRAQVPTIEGSGASPSLPPGPFGPNTQFVVTGLRTDQSYLADIIQELERFLRESEVSVESPWAG